MRPLSSKGQKKWCFGTCKLRVLAKPFLGMIEFFDCGVGQNALKTVIFVKGG
jgi:hypothetical protein